MKLMPIGTIKETMYLAGIHKAVLKLKSASTDQKEKSTLWLEEHGFIRKAMG